MTTKNVPRGFQSPQLNNIRIWGQVMSKGVGTTPSITKYGHKSLQIQAWLQLSQQDISIKQPFKKSLKQRGKQEILPRMDVGWVRVSFLVASDKCHNTHTHTHTHTHLASYTIIENKWSLGEITITGCNKRMIC